MKQFVYIATETAPASQHVHANRVKKGEKYVCKKTDHPDFVAITGNLYTKDMGRDKVYEKHIAVSLVKPYLKLFI